MTREPSLRPAAALAAFAAVLLVLVWWDTRRITRRGRYRQGDR